MGQPIPPGDNTPLYEGLGSEWNDIVGAFPEDKRNELAPLLKSRLDDTIKQYEPLKAWEDLHKSGITPDQAGTALNLFSVIENNPREVYETIGKHLGLTPQQAQQAVEEMEATTDSDDPRLQTLQQQVDTLTQIALAQRQMTTQQQMAAEAEAELDKNINDLKKKYGDFDEEEVIMRMLHKNLTAEQAYQEYNSKVEDMRRRRPAPMLLGSGGAVPSRSIDVTKLDNGGVKNLVAQMMAQSNDARNNP